MKHTKFLVIGSIIVSSLASASVFAVNSTNEVRTERTSKSQKSHKSWTQANTGSIVPKMPQDATWKTNITRTVINIANGVQITETTADAVTLAKLNARFTKVQANVGTNPKPLVSVTRTQLADGIQTTITSTDAATVTKIQSNGGNFGKMQDSGRNGLSKMNLNITRTAINIANGIQISETTADVPTLAKLNERFIKEQSQTPKNANPLVTITRTQLSNGIQTTITSTDAATVTKIQSNGWHFYGKNAGLKKSMGKKTRGGKHGNR